MKLLLSISSIVVLTVCLPLNAGASTKTKNIDDFSTFFSAGVINCNDKGIKELLIPKGVVLKNRDEGWIIVCDTITFTDFKSKKNKKKLQQAIKILTTKTAFDSAKYSPNLLVSSDIVIKAKTIKGAGVISTYNNIFVAEPKNGKEYSAPASQGKNGGRGGDGKNARCRMTWSGPKVWGSTKGHRGSGGQNGVPGADGRHGNAGNAGNDAHRVDIVAKDFDRGASLKVFTVGENGQGGSNGSAGQIGGIGGDGGRGGKGGNAASCKSASRGGHGGTGGKGGIGGDGGNGGNGGNGGHGGNVSVQGTLDSVRYIEVFNTGGKGGSGGSGGQGGKGGKGGKGGPAGCGGGADDSWLRSHGAGKCGNHGSNGKNGENGRDGIDGKEGRDGKKGQTIFPKVTTFTPSVLDNLFFERS